MNLSLLDDGEYNVYCELMVLPEPVQKSLWIAALK